jgi:hypothetical protein
MRTTTEALDAITLDTWTNTDTAGRIRSFLANRALAFAEVEDFSDDTELVETAA